MGFMDRVYVLVTMDVERPRLDKNASGPENWDASAAYIRGYTEQAAAHGFPVSPRQGVPGTQLDLDRHRP